MKLLALSFEPFFTTKEVGKGSGLGLPQVLGVAKQLGGGVSIQTRPGAGTTVNVYLPRAHEGPAPSETLATWREPCPNTGATGVRKAMVLLVDDDNDVRAAAAGMLRYTGHDVIEAANGREALDLLGREGDRIDLMIVDFVMPRMNGIEVARRARLSRPGLPILFVTGFANTAALAAQTNSELILRKPFRTTELVAKIGEAFRSVPAAYHGG